MRMIVTFQKGEAVRLIGHLDLMRAMQRALRRSELPIRYSNGFNPHILLSFAMPLSVGVAGRRELMDVPLAFEISPAEFVRRLNEALPECLWASSARLVPDEFPTLMALVAASDLMLRLPKGQDADEIAAALERLMDMNEYMMPRKTKSGTNDCDIRPFLLSAGCEHTADDLILSVRVAMNSVGSIKPSLLMEALKRLADIPEMPYLAVRERMLAKDAAGNLVPLETYGETYAG